MGTSFFIIVIIIGAIVQIISSIGKQKKNSPQNRPQRIPYLTEDEQASDDQIGDNSRSMLSEGRSLIEKSNEIKDQIKRKNENRIGAIGDPIGRKRRNSNKIVFSKTKIAESYILSECLSKPRALRPHPAVDRNHRKIK